MSCPGPGPGLVSGQVMLLRFAAAVQIMYGITTQHGLNIFLEEINAATSGNQIPSHHSLSSSGIIFKL